MIRYKISPEFDNLKEAILALPARMEKEGRIIQNFRNTIKVMDLNGVSVNVKSFKKPHFINQIAYAYFRKSKARRSFEYAEKLRRLNVGTPAPVAYISYSNVIGITCSYYISLQIDYDFTFEELTKQKPADLDLVLKAFARFTFDFHSKGIYFLDHTPANTLIKRLPDGTYEFYLVDLNRMKFKNVPSYEGLENFSKLRTTPEMSKIIATEYAALTYANAEEMVKKLTSWVEEHNRKVRRKRVLKGLTPDY